MQPVRRADNLATLMCRLSRNLGASTSWNPKVLSRPAMGLLFTFFAFTYIQFLPLPINNQRARHNIRMYNVTCCLVLM
jgi:hypothetical protein